MQLRLTQYLRPNGRMKDIFVNVPSELDVKIVQIEQAGLTFSCEAISLDSVTLYISDNEDDLAIEFADNGPGENSPQNCLIRMIQNFRIPTLGIKEKSQTL